MSRRNQVRESQSGSICKAVIQLISTKVRNLFLCEPQQQELLAATVPDALSAAFMVFPFLCSQYQLADFPDCTSSSLAMGYHS